MSNTSNTPKIVAPQPVIRLLESCGTHSEELPLRVLLEANAAAVALLVVDSGDMSLLQRFVEITIEAATSVEVSEDNLDMQGLVHALPAVLSTLSGDFQTALNEAELAGHGSLSLLLQGVLRFHSEVTGTDFAEAGKAALELLQTAA